MAWSDSDLSALKAALVQVATGAQEVSYADGRRVKFNTPDQVAAAIKVVEAGLRMQAQALSGVVRRRTPFYRSGL